VITAEEAVALRGALKQLQTALDAVVRERDEARVEVERMREVIRTIRARCVEMDDSDAVSETLDIASAFLEGKP